MATLLMAEKRESERGVALIVAMFILLILTALGLSAVDTSVFEQKMSGSLVDQGAAFQAAESGLRVGEGFIEGLAALPTAVSACNARTPAAIAAGGCVSLMGTVNGGVFTNGAPWGGVNTFVVSAYPSGSGEVSAPPEFVVEYVTNLPDTNSSLGIGTGQNLPGSDFYRVTARGTGRTGVAQAIVQSVYARRF